ncbi:MAG: hypothetical protein COX02_00220 [Candidatus Vogelbacteria bacterium CG22_combo_CG10-13_8_21_14_all_37_9]|uniref:Uncharacterized protein n=1 Tax=Candidatus Vogelbacteria bacterium CG22_combo_CG10-13_8_21_14_all_37_9 TaxID=1975046 RepID=A0A2H0BLG7_9BACT|nr:MAG: hypothetical protein COX02_00220 [Candidatus Vogelbacteria bacterium CG22_combo_CG10-13_8_21_14_all_37_9]
MENFNLEIEAENKGVKAIGALEAQAQEIGETPTVLATKLKEFLIGQQMGGLKLVAVGCEDLVKKMDSAQ